MLMCNCHQARPRPRDRTVAGPGSRPGRGDRAVLAPAGRGGGDAGGGRRTGGGEDTGAVEEVFVNKISHEGRA